MPTVNLKSDFAARGNGISDDTDAFNAVCREAEKTRRSYTVILDDGIYEIKGSFHQWENAELDRAVSQIRLPSLDLSNDAPITISFRGHAPIAGNTNWTNDRAPLNESGAIIRSSVEPSQYWHSMIAGSAPKGAKWAHSACLADFQNVGLRCKYATAIDLGFMGYASIQGCLIDSGTILCDIAEPSNYRTGVIMPAQANWVKARLIDTDIVGFGCGLIGSEHLVADDVRIFLCKIGAQFKGGPHASAVRYLKMVGCQIAVMFYDHKTILKGGMQFDIEHTNGHLTGSRSWTNTIADIHDASDLAQGIIDFNSVRSYVGPENSMSVIGGQFLSTINQHP